jgi:hypothetical protein
MVCWVLISVARCPFSAHFARLHFVILPIKGFFLIGTQAFYQPIKALLRIIRGFMNRITDQVAQGQMPVNGPNAPVFAWIAAGVSRGGLYM